MIETKTGAFIELDACDLPVCCPNRTTSVWNSHPRVFLMVADTGEAHCPYCGAAYLIDPETLAHAAH